MCDLKESLSDIVANIKEKKIHQDILNKFKYFIKDVNIF